MERDSDCYKGGGREFHVWIAEYLNEVNSDFLKISDNIGSESDSRKSIVR